MNFSHYLEELSFAYIEQRNPGQHCDLSKYHEEVDTLPEEGLTEQEKSDLKQVGRKIRRIRTARHMTQEALASLADAQSGGKGVSRFENGERQMKLTTFFRFAAGLEVTPNDISPDRLLSPEAIQVAEFSELTPYHQKILKIFLDSLRKMEENNTQGNPYSPIPMGNS